MKEFDFELDKSVFLSKSNFSEYIEKLVLEESISYFDAILRFSLESDKEPAELLNFMSPVLLEKVRRSAIESDLHKSDTSVLDEFL